VPVVFLLFELLFGFVQALVFALLTMTYITLAIAEHRQHESGDEHAGRQPEEREASPAPGTA
jgi:F-type H+-transporting ATPase subunit a